MERARRIPPRKAAVRERIKAALRQASVSEIVVGRWGTKRGRSVVMEEYWKEEDRILQF